MVIRTISQRYRVIRRLSGSNQVKGYVCREDGCSSKKLYLLMKVIKPALAKKMLLYFMKLRAGENKGDFLNFFINKECLWLVFRYYKYPLLYDKVKGNIRLKERLEASRTMAEQVLIQNLPCYLQYEALNPKNIVVSDVPEVHFNFLLLNTEKFGKCNLADVQMRLAESMKVLFKPELKKDAMPKLKDFVEGLQEKDYLSYSQIFGDYRRLYEFMVPLADEALPDKGSLLLRLWEQFKRCSNVLKRVLYTTVIAVLIGMIIYIIIKPETVSNDKVQFDQIGTLKIQQENGDRDESW